MKRRALLAFAAAGALALLAAGARLGAPRAAEPQLVPMRQIWVIDGDTLDVLEPEKERIRLEARIRHWCGS